MGRTDGSPGYTHSGFGFGFGIVSLERMGCSMAVSGPKGVCVIEFDLSRILL